MKIGLIDCDSHNFPNLPLMKISAWHKKQGDRVEWYEPLLGGRYDRVYISKVFSASSDYLYNINADEIIKGGTGFCIESRNGKEYFNKEKDTPLPHEIEHVYPDYSLYGINDTAYGFMSRGCPRCCGFCHVSAKEGARSKKVADLEEFYKGQKRIELMDPNILACRDRKELLQQLIDCKARVNFNQGLDIRLMSEETAEMISRINIEAIHFAWDTYEEKNTILPQLKAFRAASEIDSRNLRVYVLCGYNTTFEQDLERVYTIRDLGFSPYVMLYNKTLIPRGAKLRKLQRYVNSPQIFHAIKTFDDYN